MTTVRLDNAVTEWNARPHMTYRDQVVRALAAARDEASTIEFAAALAQVQSDYVYLDRVVAGHEDTSRYLDTMITEFEAQAQANYDLANDESDLDDIVRYRVLAIRAEAKAEAYRDAARVFDVPFEVALKLDEEEAF